MNYTVPINEAKRLKTLRRYQILDTPAEPALPLQAGDGNNIGTRCVIDRTPRDLTDEQCEGLALLSRQVVALELRPNLHQWLARNDRTALRRRAVTRAAAGVCRDRLLCERLDPSKRDRRPSQFIATRNHPAPIPE